MNANTSTLRNLSGPGILNKERDFVSPYRGPSGFHWLVNGLLGGVRRPGVLTKTKYDLEALRRVNVSLLITLNEVWSPPVEEMAALGLDSYVHKITDLQAPTFEQALATCRHVDSYLAKDKVCVYHCRAGVGRTGTMLTAQLMYYGLSADQAIRAAREKNPRWIETDVQMEFLYEFDKYLDGKSI
ncbi:MAG: hypothetical protein L3J37_11885 [Rhodobacteraceae bacterium]|nr:hypothetical protein [Paracoccaceae bacterium]